MTAIDLYLNCNFIYITLSAPPIYLAKRIFNCPEVLPTHFQLPCFRLRYDDHTRGKKWEFLKPSVSGG